MTQLFLKLSQSCFFPPVPIIIPSFLELPSGKRLQKAIENGPVEIVDFPSYKMVDLSNSYVNVYQRVNPIKPPFS